MELFIYPHTVGILQDLLFDTVHQLKHEVSEMRLCARQDVLDPVSHLDTIQLKLGKLEAFNELLEQLQEYVNN